MVILSHFLGGNLITWKSNKQTVVARSSAEVEYQALAHTSCEILWLKHFFKELMFEVQLPMSMYCNNQVVIHIASNPVFHERTKHIKVYSHIIRERVELLYSYLLVHNLLICLPNCCSNHS